MVFLSFGFCLVVEKIRGVETYHCSLVFLRFMITLCSIPEKIINALNLALHRYSKHLRPLKPKGEYEIQKSTFLFPFPVISKQFKN